MIEPIREMLDAGFQSDVSDQDERWVKALREDILTSMYRWARVCRQRCATFSTCSPAM